jgi:Protein of unknown function (DUF3035)
MARRDKWLRMTGLAVLLGSAVGMEGCQAVREATGATKQAPDEFTVLTKAPLVIPPDYNLRPPQPGVASRNQIDPDEQAQAALFAPSAADQVAALGTDYSDGEKLLLSRSQALVADPDIRRTVNADAGQEDQGPAFAAKVLYEGANPPPPRVVAAPNGQVIGAPAPREGFFARNFGIGSSGETATQVAQPVVQPQMVAQPAPQAVPQPQMVAQVAAPAPQIVAAPQPVIASAPQAAPAPQLVYAPQPAPAQPQYVVTQTSDPVEQPGWFTRNFIMSPEQRAALAAGQPVPPSVTQRLQMAQQQQQLQQPQIVQAAPAPQVAAAPGQFVAPQVVVAQPQAVIMPAIQTAQTARPEPKNLYQYLFGTPAAAATIVPAPQPVAQPQPAMPQPAPQPVQPQAQPQPEKEGWFSRNFGL